MTWNVLSAVLSAPYKQRDNAQRSGLRLPVLSSEVVVVLDEFLRFRHVVRNIYAFQFDPLRIERLVQQMRPTFQTTKLGLQIFATFLERVGSVDI